MSVEAVVEEEMTLGKNISANVRIPDHTGPPKRPAQMAGRAGPSDGLCFVGDQ